VTARVWTDEMTPDEEKNIGLEMNMQISVLNTRP
jgi:hypothetical protein